MLTHVYNDPYEHIAEIAMADLPAGNVFIRILQLHKTSSVLQRKKAQVYETMRLVILSSSKFKGFLHHGQTNGRNKSHFF